MISRETGACVAERGAGAQRGHHGHSLGEFGVARASGDRSLALHLDAVRALRRQGDGNGGFGQRRFVQSLEPTMASGASWPMGPTRLRCVISNIAVIPFPPVQLATD